MVAHSPRQTLATLAGWSAAASGAAIPVSVAATGILVASSILLGLASGLYARHWRAMIANPVTPVALLLFGWLALSLAYTEVSLDEGLRVLKKYRELLLIPLFIPLLADPRVRRWTVHAFVAAMLLTLLLSYAEAMRQIVESGALVRDPEVFKHRITQNTLLAFTAYWAWLQAERDPARRWLWLSLIAVIAFNVFVMVSGRSGQLIFLALAALALVRRFHWKGIVLTALMGALLLGAAFAMSDLIRERTLETLNGLRDYEAMDFSTSTAIRISFYPNSLALIEREPWLGHGVGSISKVYRQQVEGTRFPPTQHPHNEFLTLGIQAGVPAMLLLAWLFASQWRQGARMSEEQRRLSQAMLLTMVLGCLLNSFLLDSTEGHWYALFSALFLYPRAGGADDQDG
jgi:O-antigen ligase